jgi:hypothetical protein
MRLIQWWAFGSLACACSAAPPPARPVDATPTDAGTQTLDVDSGRGLEPDAFPEIEAGNLELGMLPRASFSGFDGVHTYRVPIAVYQYDPKDVKISISDPALADIVPASYSGSGDDAGKYYLLTIKKVGNATILAESRGKMVTSTLRIVGYAPALYAQGETRYRASSTKEPACSACHEAAGGADHSPTSLSSAVDGVLRGIITSGIKGGGIPITKLDHRWTLTDSELDGLVAYLRALPPRGYTPQ